MWVTYLHWKGGTTTTLLPTDVIPFDHCFMLINEAHEVWNTDGKKWVVFSAKVIPEGDGIFRMDLWANAATGQVEGSIVSREADCRGEVAATQQIPTPVGQSSIYVSFDDYEFESSKHNGGTEKVRFISVQIKGNGLSQFTKATNCQFAEWTCGNDIVKSLFTGTCVDSSFWNGNGWWTRFECGSSALQITGIKHVTQSMCLEDPETESTSIQSRQDDFTEFPWQDGTCTLTTCNQSPVAQTGVNVPVTTPVDSRRQDGCQGDVPDEEHCKEFLTIFEPVQADADDVQKLLAWVEMLEQDQCEYWFEKVLGALGDRWEGGAYWYAGCVNVKKQADTKAVLIRWWIGAKNSGDFHTGWADAIHKLSIGAGGGGDAKPITIDTGFGVNDPMQQNQFQIKMGTNTMIVDKAKCGFKNTEFVMFTAHFAGGASSDTSSDAAYMLWQQLDDSGSNQCEFWMRKVLELGCTANDPGECLGIPAADSETCIGCQEVTAGTDFGAKVEWWVSGSTRSLSRVEDMSTQQAGKLSSKKGNDFLVTHPTLGNLAFTMKSNVKKGTKSTVCGKKAAVYTEVTFTIGGETERLFNHWETDQADMDMCVLWMKNVLELGAGGWDDTKQVCTGCVDIKKGSAIIRVSVSGIEQSHVNQFVDEQKKLIGTSKDTSSLIRQENVLTFDNVVDGIVSEGSNPNGPGDGGSDSEHSTTSSPVMNPVNPVEVPDDIDDSILGMGSTVDIAIFVGVGIVVIAIIALVSYLLCRSKKKSQRRVTRRRRSKEEFRPRGSRRQEGDANANQSARAEEYDQYGDLNLKTFQV